MPCLRRGVGATDVSVLAIFLLCATRAVLDVGAAGQNTGGTPDSPVTVTGFDLEEVVLSDWTMERGGPRVRVRDGNVISVSGGRGWLRSRPAFLDFVLRLEFRATSADAEGAVLVRTSTERRGDWPNGGVRVVTRDRESREGRTDVSAFEGDAEDIVEPTPAPKADVGDWQALEIHAERDRIRVAIDGAVVRDVRVSEAWAGSVGIEGLDGSMEYRNIRVVPLPTVLACGTVDRRARSAERDVPGFKEPRLERQILPRYTLGAIERKAVGVVWLDAEVLSDGTVGDMCMMRSLDPELDLQAVAAARRWRFEPATRDGVPVSTFVTIELTFNLR